MRIWSIQSIEAWEHLQRHGSLLARRQHRAGDWPHAYDWMRAQLIRRIGPPPESDVEPLWGWYQWCSKSTRPDLRALRHYWGPEGNHVMIECELPEREVLLSDHDAWHFVLNDWHLALDEQKGDAYNGLRRLYEGKAGHDKFRRLIERRLKRLKRDRQESWELIFDLDALDNDYWGRTSDKSIQACFWTINLNQVNSCKPFRSRHPKFR